MTNTNLVLNIHFTRRLMIKYDFHKVSAFSIHHEGYSDITNHRKIIRNKSAEELASISKVDNYFKKAVPRGDDLTLLTVSLHSTL